MSEQVGIDRELKSAGLKATAPRRRILELFQKKPESHWSAEDVYREMMEQGDDVGLATVYRVLTQFEQAGLLVRHNFDQGKAVFELNSDGHHDHLVCLDCGHVEEFYDEAIERRQDELAVERGFEVKAHALNLYVHCKKKDCPNKQ
uniref:Ferric uptake regulation protein n=1 Tax=Magnetococcus massalia (strain MO-1) TaxID=451514 RepID=A0A1S7LCG8_MAGMO|nr:Ferric uptake regulation protein [Candidatus Magnetococcus massalia]